MNVSTPVLPFRRPAGPGAGLCIVYGEIDGKVVVLKRCTLAERDDVFDEILRTRPEVNKAWTGRAGGWRRVERKRKLTPVSAKPRPTTPPLCA